jgi:hypothetical protein
MILDSLTGDVDRTECTVIDGQSDFVADIEAIGTAIEPVRADGVRRIHPTLNITPVVRLDG